MFVDLDFTCTFFEVIYCTTRLFSTRQTLTLTLFTFACLRFFVLFLFDAHFRTVQAVSFDHYSDTRKEK